MPRFRCEMQMADGRVVTQTVEAGSMTEASSRARQQGGYVLNVTSTGGGSSPTDLIAKLRSVRFEKPPGLKDIMAFSKQLSVMIKAGISITEAIEGIAEQVTHQRFKKILNRIHDDIEAGQTFSAALAKHPRVFSPLYVNMVRASEMSGQFAHMLERIVEYLEQADETQRMVRGAMIYPAVLITLCIGAVTFLMTWLVPRFVKVFEGKEQFLPTPTIILLAISDFMKTQWWLLLAIVALMVLSFSAMLRSKTGRWYWDSFVLRVPLVRRLLRSLYITRSLQAFGELINAGVPILDSLDITARIAGNQLYVNLWKQVRNTVKEGGKIVYQLRETDLMPKSVIQMISAGEESGRLGEVLEDVSEYYNKELKSDVKLVLGLLEPFMILVMGGVIGFVVLSIMLPVFSIQKMLSDQM
jgi:type IV pilus assembly protein PilC